MLCSAARSVGGGRGDQFRHYSIYPRPPLPASCPGSDGSGGITGAMPGWPPHWSEERAAHPEALTAGRRGLLHGLPDPDPVYHPGGGVCGPWALMGYDAVTVGNHEFDGTGSGFGEMLTAATPERGCDPGPALANYRPSE
ncbi:MAG: hypothetical protein ACLR0P_13605 [Oscillospiraceae bacterium]